MGVHEWRLVHSHVPRNFFAMSLQRRQTVSEEGLFALGLYKIYNGVVSWMENLFHTREILENKNDKQENLKSYDKRAMYFVDSDDKGLFVNVIHATSSCNIESIRILGLRPITDVRSSVKRYLQSICPDAHNDTLEEVLSQEYLERHRTHFKHALSIRLEQDDHGSRLFMLTLCGTTGYLKSAANNALFDGGEVFMTARHVLEERLNRTLRPGFLDAYPIVIIGKCYFDKNLEDGLKITNLEGEQLVDIGRQPSTHFICSTGEFRLNIDIPPEHIEVVSLDDFLRIETLESSENAYKELIRMIKP